jgi:hypothetical protein
LTFRRSRFARFVETQNFAFPCTVVRLYGTREM